MARRKFRRTKKESMMKSFPDKVSREKLHQKW